MEEVKMVELLITNHPRHYKGEVVVRDEKLAEKLIKRGWAKKLNQESDKLQPKQKPLRMQSKT